MMTDGFTTAQETALKYLPRAANREDPLVEHECLSDLNVYRFWQVAGDRLALIADGRGEFLTVNSRVTREQHIEAFKSGRRTDPAMFGDTGYIHPDLVRLVAQEEAARIIGYKRGDVNHWVNPIIGMLRIRQGDGKPLSDSDFEHAIEALTKATYAELAWLDQTGDL